jgi:gliding motility-associated-like protein
MLLMKNFLSIIFLLFPFVSINAQQANNWYFGDHAAVSFSTGSPLFLNNSQMQSVEGVATISDGNGSLLFYTNGITVWNKLHQQMVNGFGLNGHQSSTQSGVIVPHPYNDSIYYVFTVDAIAGLNGLCYSVININHDTGLGEAVQKNIPLLSPTCEKITAVKHCNGKDIWVITRLWNSDKYYSYLISNTGINTTPVISSTGFWVGDPLNINSGAEAQGYLKVSPNGKKVAAAHSKFSDIEMLDFNSSTGILNNLKKITTFGSTVYAKNNYGLEFSPNNKYLYVSASGQNFFGDPILYALLLQYNLTSNDETQIKQSRVVIDSNATIPYKQRGAIQIGPDGKLYSLRAFTQYLDCIHNPNQAGVACNFQSNAVHIGTTGQTILGLPNFIQSYFKPQISTSADCISQNIGFSLSDITDVDSVKWNFGDIGSGGNNFSTSFTPTHQFSTSGVYQIQLQVFSSGGCAIDTLYKTIYAGALSINLGKDTAICQQDTLKLRANIPGVTIKWSDGSVDTSLNVTQTGQYWVKISIGNCSFSDTIDVTIENLPQFTLGNDSVICNNATVTIQPSVMYNNAVYLWNTNATTSSITTGNAGDYWLRITDINGCKWRDTIKVSFKTLPGFNLGIDTAICAKDTLLLNATVSGANSYVWNNGTTSPTLKVFQQNIYWCDVSKDGCTFRDSLIMEIKPLPLVNFGNDISLCEENTLLLDATNPNAAYLWQDASTNSNYLVKQKGQYRVRVTMNGCIAKDTINVDYNLKPKFSLGVDSRICLGNELILDPKITSVNYLWQDGSTNPTYTVTQPGVYSLTATNSCGPTTDYITIGNGICDLYVPNTFTPNGDTKNDLFKASYGDNVTEFHLQVYNRYGQIVFETKDKNKGWDGKFLGSRQPFGAYAWIIQYKTSVNRSLQKLQGTVLLIH